jgi:hypothetical protein
VVAREGGQPELTQLLIGGTFALQDVGLVGVPGRVVDDDGGDGLVHGGGGLEGLAKIAHMLGGVLPGTPGVRGVLQVGSLDLVPSTDGVVQDPDLEVLGSLVETGQESRVKRERQMIVDI